MPDRKVNLRIGASAFLTVDIFVFYLYSVRYMKSLARFGRWQRASVAALTILAVVFPAALGRIPVYGRTLAIPATPPTPPDPTPTPTPSPTPTPTPTPTPILRNGSFETDDDNNNLPDSWTPKKLDVNDILDTMVVYDGIKSFKFSPAATQKEQLTQTLNYSGGTDEEVRLEVYNQSDGRVAIGKAGAVLTITYADGRSETSSAVFPYAAHDWKKKTLVIVTDEIYSQIKVNFFNTNQDTNVRVDNSSLSIIPGAQRRGVKQTGNELTVAELKTLN